MSSLRRQRSGKGRTTPPLVPETDVVLMVSGEDPPLVKSSSGHIGPSSPGKSSPGHSKPPVSPLRPEAAPLLRQRHSHSWPKSRFFEPSPPRVIGTGEDHPSARHSHSLEIVAATDEDEDEEEEEDGVYSEERVDNDAQKKRRRTPCSFWVLLELSILLSAVACLATSFSLRRVRMFRLWDLEVRKWCIVAIVICCGRVFTGWLVVLLVFTVERNSLLRKKVIYFVYGLRYSLRVFIWLGVVLLSWLLLINQETVRRSAGTVRKLNFVTKAMVALLVGSVVWMVKTFLVKFLAASFHGTASFDRIQESIIHQYVLQTISGQPVMELTERVGTSRSSGQLSIRNIGKEKGKGKKKEKYGVIDVGKLNRLRSENVTTWTMKGLVNFVRGSRFLIISDTIDHSEKRVKEITCEWEAIAAASHIFKNVAKPEIRFIEEEDLLRFLSKEDVDFIFPQFEGASETGKIKKSAFRNWVVKAYLDRKSLSHSLNDTKTAVNQINKLISAISIAVISMLSLLIMGFATTKVFLFISSQLVLVAFIFGNTCKTTFEAIVFMFIMHPFDVGDRCVIDGIQMVVEEMNIMTTSFINDDNEKICFPNATLATKPINNLNRSPNKKDSVEFSIDVKIVEDLKARIKSYIDSKPQHWHPKHSVVGKDFVGLNKINMVLNVLHTMNHQNIPERNARRTKLMRDLDKIIEELSIQSQPAPQEVHLS